MGMSPSGGPGLYLSAWREEVFTPDTSYSSCFNMEDTTHLYTDEARAWLHGMKVALHGMKALSTGSPTRRGARHRHVRCT